MASPNSRARKALAQAAAPVEPAPLAVVSGIQVTIQYGVLVGTVVQQQHPLTVNLPMPESLLKLPEEIEAKRRELQATVEKQMADEKAAAAPPNPDGSE